MIDVVFLLLCFFVSSQLFAQWETEVGITLPTAESGDAPQRAPGEIILNIFEDGAVVVNSRAFDNAELLGLLTRVVELFPGNPVLIRADERTDYEHIMRVLDLCRQCDIQNVSFATSRPTPTPSS